MEKYELKELNLQMSKLEYEMFQDIPAKENGSTNLCHGVPYENFGAYLENQMARKYQNVSQYDTLTIIYIMYVNDLPVGYVGIRTKIDDNWKKWSGNVFYAIRSAERHKHYGTKILELAIEKCKELGIAPIYAQANKNNIYSQKAIENNGGKLYLETETKYYVIQKCWKFFWINSIFCNFLKIDRCFIIFLWKTKNAMSSAKPNNSTFYVVDRRGLEPRTHWLRVSCSTNWANSPQELI